jgi:hypothetical protein
MRTHNPRRTVSTQKFIAREPYRFDNGAIGWRPGGPFDCLGPYAKIQQCPVHGVPGLRLTCYATGYADTWFSVPACTRHRGRYISGYFSTETGTANGIEFRPHTVHMEHLRAPAPPVPPIRPGEDAADFLATVLWLRDGYEEQKPPQHRTRKNWTIHEIHPELVTAVRQFCQGFREYLETLPDDLFPVNWENYLERSFGGSVFFTLSGHGCSFRDEYSDPDRTLGDTLAKALHTYAGDRYRFEELAHDLSAFHGKLHLSRRTAAARREALARYFTPAARAMRYRLTIYWQSYPPSVAVKRWVRRSDAETWKTLCLEICGKDQDGNPYTRATLEPLPDDAS